jgi:hypothetical protein
MPADQTEYSTGDWQSTCTADVDTMLRKLTRIDKQLTRTRQCGATVDSHMDWLDVPANTTDGNAAKVHVDALADCFTRYRRIATVLNSNSEALVKSYDHLAGSCDTQIEHSAILELLTVPPPSGHTRFVGSYLDTTQASVARMRDQLAKFKRPKDGTSLEAATSLPATTGTVTSTKEDVSGIVKASLKTVDEVWADVFRVEAILRSAPSAPPISRVQQP